VRIERRMTFPPTAACPARYQKEVVLSKAEVATLRSAERIAAKVRAAIKAETDGVVDTSENWRCDLRVARLEHAADQLATNGGVVLA